VKSPALVRFIAAIACGGALLTPCAAMAQAGPDPCKLLTPAEVSAAMGTKMSDGMPIANTGCSWNAAHLIASFSYQLHVDWGKLKAPSLAPGLSKSSVSGVGDDAVFSIVQGDKPFVSLSVKKGARIFMVRVYGVASVEDQKRIEKTLASQAAARL